MSGVVYQVTLDVEGKDGYTGEVVESVDLEGVSPVEVLEAVEDFRNAALAGQSPEFLPYFAASIAMLRHSLEDSVTVVDVEKQ